ncbi:hypothetical protein [Candidatus Coxiella mudrowiae]|nr:hypothetical protein [Candidatus Coxiella mudrowiae]
MKKNLSFLEILETLSKENISGAMRGSLMLLLMLLGVLDCNVKELKQP